MTTTRTQVSFLGVAMLGAVLGGFLVPRLARACECPDPTWLVSLASVTAEDANMTDDGLWPSDGDIRAGSSSMTMELNYGETDGEIAMLRIRGIK